MMDAVPLFIGGILGAVAATLFLWLKVIRNLKKELVKKQDEFEEYKKYLLMYCKVYKDFNKIKKPNIIAYKILRDIKAYLKNIKKLSEILGNKIVTPELEANYKYYTKFYPEILSDSFSLKEISQRAFNYRESDLFKNIEALLWDEHKNQSGHVYVMTNPSLPGLVKIGCSCNPFIRRLQLTDGMDYREKNNTDLHQVKEEAFAMNTQDMLQPKDYLYNLNRDLRTSLPSEFKIEFCIKSEESFVDENIVHHALEAFNIKRGAGTEFFLLPVEKVRKVFKAIFYDGRHQWGYISEENRNFFKKTKYKEPRNKDPRKPNPTAVHRCPANALGTEVPVEHCSEAGSAHGGMTAP